MLVTAVTVLIAAHDPSGAAPLAVPPAAVDKDTDGTIGAELCLLSFCAPVPNR